MYYTHVSVRFYNYINIIIIIIMNCAQHTLLCTSLLSKSLHITDNFRKTVIIECIYEWYQKVPLPYMAKLSRLRCKISIRGKAFTLSCCRLTLPIDKAIIRGKTFGIEWETAKVSLSNALPYTVL